MKEEEVKPEGKTEAKKKGKKLRKFIIFLVVVAIIIVALGFLFPGLLWPNSLGIKYTSEDYNSMMTKLNYIKDAAPTGDSESEYTYTYGEIKNVDVEFTSEELTAFFNENRPSYYAVKNVQIRINSDGTIEAIATANVDYFLNEFLSGEFSKEEINRQFPALGILPNNVNMYLKFSGAVNDNKSSVSVQEVSVQGVSIPYSLVSSGTAMNVVTGGCDNIMSKYNSSTGSSFDSISIQDSKIKFLGRVPSSLERTQN